MAFTRALLKKILMLNCYILTQPAQLMKSENVYEEFYQWKDLFDFSNYSKNSRFYDESNKRIIGKMKDEYGGVIINEFNGLKSKMYSIKKLTVLNLIPLKE